MLHVCALLLLLCECRVEDVLGKKWHHHVEGRKLKQENDQFRGKLQPLKIFQVLSSLLPPPPPSSLLVLCALHGRSVRKKTNVFSPTLQFWCSSPAVLTLIIVLHFTLWDSHSLSPLTLTLNAACVLLCCCVLLVLLGVACVACLPACLPAPTDLATGEQQADEAVRFRG